jgi:hypothetical protein
MRWYYIALLCWLAPMVGWGQAPLLLPTRNLAAELQTQAQLGWRQLFLASSFYQPVSEQWLNDSFLPKFKKVVQRLRMKSRSEGFDCDNFSELFRNEMAIANHLAGRSALGEVACAVLVVEQQRSFGRVAANRGGGLHSLVLVRTDNGWRVIEPQTLKVASLDRYPNRNHITSVYF